MRAPAVLAIPPDRGAVCRKKLTSHRWASYILDMSTADLDARSRRWAATDIPASLWPNLDLELLASSALQIERCVSAILAERPASLGSSTGAEADAIGIAALISGTGPLLGYWVEQGLLDVSEPVAKVLARHLEHGRGRYARIRHEIAPVLEGLVAAGVQPAVLKGFHTAHVYFPEPGVRPLADVDLYVEPRLVARADLAIGAAGFHRHTNSGKFKGVWFPERDAQPIQSLEYWHQLSPWRIELHAALDFGTLKRHGVHLETAMPVDETWCGLGMPLRVAPQPLLLVGIATHASGELHAARLLRLIELTWMIRRDESSGALDWSAVEWLLESTGATRFTYPAFTLVEQLAPGTIKPSILALSAQRSTPIARSVVGELTPATPILNQRASIAERLMWEPGMFGIVRRVFEMFLPASDVSLRDALGVYRGRARRLLSGRVSWRFAPQTHSARPAQGSTHD